MKKSNYYSLRDAAWQMLLDSDTTVPIEPINIIKSHKWLATSFDSTYGQFFLKTLTKNVLTSKDAITFSYAGYVYILYNNNLPTSRIRFSLAHEIGHVILQHQARKIDNYEMEANMFAARLLMPMVLIKELSLVTPEAISKVCGVSLQAATYRLTRYELLRRRNKFYRSNLELQLLEKYRNEITRIKNGNTNH